MPAGKQIKRLREKADVSAENLAKWIGVKADRLRKWEQRDSDPREVDRVKVESYFNRPIDELDKLEYFDFYVSEPHSPGALELGDPPPSYHFSGKKSDVETLLEIVNKLSETVNNQSSALRDQAEALKSITTNRGNANGHTATAV